MNIFQKITPYRSDIAMKLLTNEVIVKLLSNLGENTPISEIEMPEDVYSLYKTKVFTRTNVDGLVDKEDCYIMLSFPIVMPNKTSPNVFMNTKLVFNVMCHKAVINTYEGDRIDAIVSEIFTMFDGNREFGFKIESPIVKEYSHRNYYMVSIEFDLLDFVNNGWYSIIKWTTL